GSLRGAVTVLRAASGVREAGDVRGDLLFATCVGCHTPSQFGGTGIGPTLEGIVGRPIGAEAGFGYSEALRSLGGRWTEANLDRFLADPQGFAPGNRMAFEGLPDPEERAALVRHLRTLEAEPEPLGVIGSR